jgi:hypothetical protein
MASIKPIRDIDGSGYQLPHCGEIKCREGESLQALWDVANHSAARLIKTCKPADRCGNDHGNQNTMKA